MITTSITVPISKDQLLSALRSLTTSADGRRGRATFDAGEWSIWDAECLERAAALIRREIGEREAAQEVVGDEDPIAPTPTPYAGPFKLAVYQVDDSPDFTFNPQVRGSFFGYVVSDYVLRSAGFNCVLIAEPSLGGKESKERAIDAHAAIYLAASHHAGLRWEGPDPNRLMLPVFVDPSGRIPNGEPPETGPLFTRCRSDGRILNLAGFITCPDDIGRYSTGLFKPGSAGGAIYFTPAQAVKLAKAGEQGFEWVEMPGETP